MKSINIAMVRDLLQNPRCRDRRTIHIARHFTTSFEEILEIHSAQKYHYNLPEDFLQDSIMNSYGVGSDADAEEELSPFNNAIILNRKATASEVCLIYKKLSPISGMLPWKISICSAITLFEDWSIVWIFIETHERYISAKWYTTA